MSKISDIKIEKYEEKGHIKYNVKGQLFFVATTKFIDSFEYNEKVDTIDIDFTNARIWDESAVDAIDKVIAKYNKNNIKVKLTGLNKESLNLVDKMATYDKLIN